MVPAGAASSAVSRLVSVMGRSSLGGLGSPERETEGVCARTSGRYDGGRGRRRDKRGPGDHAAGDRRLLAWRSRPRFRRRCGRRARPSRPAPADRGAIGAAPRCSAADRGRAERGVRPRRGSGRGWARPSCARPRSTGLASRLLPIIASTPATSSVTPITATVASPGPISVARLRISPTSSAISAAKASTPAMAKKIAAPRKAPTRSPTRACKARLRR